MTGNAPQQEILLAALGPATRGGAHGYAVNLSRVAQDRQGRVEVKLSLPEQQRAMFRKAEDYGVTLQHDAGLGVYFVSGSAAEVAEFLKHVRLSSDARVVSRIEMDVEVASLSRPEEAVTRRKLVVDRDDSGEVKAAFLPSATSDGVSEVVREYMREGGLGGGGLFGMDWDSYGEWMEMGEVLSAAAGMHESRGLWWEDEDGAFYPEDAKARLLRVSDMPGGPPETGFPAQPPETPEPPLQPELPIPTPAQPSPNGSGGSSGGGGGGGAPSPNAAPAFTSAGTEQVEEGTPYSYAVAAADADGDALAITAPTLPAWLALADNGDGTATLSGTPGGGDAGYYGVTLEVDDGTDSAQQNFNILVASAGMLGTAGAEALTGGVTADALYGADGDDTLDGGAGRDTLGGGAGADRFRFSASTHSTTAARDLIADFTDGADFLNLHNLWFDGFGNEAGQLSATYDIGTDQTWITDNTGTFSFALAGGDYTALLASADLEITAATEGTAGADNISAAGGIYSGGGNDTITGTNNLQVIHGGDGDDVIATQGSNDTVQGGTGNDTIDLGGNWGEDVAYGGAGNDLIYASSWSGFNTIYGGDGDDTLDGGKSDDTLTGGAGADRFRFSAGGDSTTAARDLVTDFTDGVDFLNLHNLWFDGFGGAAGQLSATYDIGTNQTWITDNTGTFSFALSGGDYTALLSDADLEITADTEGTAGADVINAAGGIYGGDGGDTLTGSGAATIHGGDGDDTVTGSGAADYIQGGAGNDSVISGSGADLVQGGAGNDYMHGGASNDTFYGGDGDDTLDGGANIDTLTGGSGNDRFRFSLITESTTTATDTVADFVQGTDKINLHNMALDEIGSEAGALSVTYDGVNDRTVVSDATTTFRFYVSGNVALTSADLEISASTEGTAGADVINAAGGIYGGDGGDTVTATGQATIHGGDGDDTITGSASVDRIHGGAGNDSIVAGNGSDILYGGAGNDIMRGDASNDSLYGGDGDDTLDGGGNADNLRGGAGADRFRFSNVTESVTPTNIDTVTDYAQGTDKINLHNMALDEIGSAGGALSFTYDGVNDRTVVSDITSTFRFYVSGNVTLTSADLVISADTEGTAGANVINAAGGIYGGDGDDTITATGQATIHGGAGNDTVTGSASADRIHGGGGNDSINGGNSTDTLYGGAGNDILIGTTSTHRLYGGEGNDTLTGGANGDFFYFDRNAAGHDDHITDMTTASDKIVLSDTAFVFTSGEGAKNGVNLTDNTDIFDVAGFAGGNFTGGAGATFLYDTTDGQLWYDADGDGGGGNAVLIATLDNFATYVYNAADFQGGA